MLVSCWQNPINGDPYSSAVPISGPEYSIPQHKTAEVESSNQLSTTLPLLIPSPGQSVIDKFTATSGWPFICSLSRRDCAAQISTESGISKNNRKGAGLFV